MTLSIVAAFCDKDYKLIPNLLINIEEKVHIPYEIILIDNREEFKDDPVDFTPATVHSKGCNAYQFEARRFAVQFCKGDYVWFIDADDKILEVKDDLIFTEDLIVFNYGVMANVLSLPPTWKHIEKAFKRQRYTHVEKENFYNYNVSGNPWDILGCTLWNKWIKTDVLKNVVKDLPENEIIVASEDIFYSAAAFTKSKTLCFCDDTIYVYNEFLAQGTCQTMTTNKFMHIIKGRKRSRELIAALNGPSWYDDIQQSVSYFYTKLVFTDDKERCFDEMKNHFSKEELIAGLSHPWTLHINKENQDLLKTFCNKIR